MNNSLKYVRFLEGVGISREQAEAHVQLITEITEGDLATKQDVIDIRRDIAEKSATKADIAEPRQGIKADIAELRQEILADRLATKAEFASVRHEMSSMKESLEHKMLQMESRLLIKLGGATAVIVGVTAALVTIIPKLLAK